MTADWAEGTVAVATVRGVEGVRVMRHGGAGWFHPVDIEGYFTYDNQVTDVRPLIVLDLSEYLGGYSAAVKVLRDTDTEIGDLIADQIEAQTRPPRIEEPGLPWQVVAHSRSSSTRARWRRSGGIYWICEDGRVADWGRLIDPVLIEAQS